MCGGSALGAAALPPWIDCGGGDRGDCTGSEPTLALLENRPPMVDEREEVVAGD